MRATEQLLDEIRRIRVKHSMLGRPGLPSVLVSYDEYFELAKLATFKIATPGPDQIYGVNVIPGEMELE